MKLVCLFAFMITLAASKHYILKLKDKKDSKSESEDDKDQVPIGADYDASSCFSPQSKVETPAGYKDMSELVLGDTVATFMEGHGKVFFKVPRLDGQRSSGCILSTSQFNKWEEFYVNRQSHNLRCGRRKADLQVRKRSETNRF